MEACWECGTVGEVHHHHPVPKSRGGTRTIPLCLLCHGKAHGRDGGMTTAALTKEALARRRARGQISGNAPLGMKLGPDGVKLVVNPDEVPFLTRALALLRADTSVRATAAILSQEGYRTRKGGPIQATTIHRLKKHYKADLLTEPDVDSDGQATLPL
jgi:hypothetical protein